MIAAFFGSLICAAISSHLCKDEKNTVKSFWISIASGTLLWQSVGECSWHFGLKCENRYLSFVHIENGSSLFLLILFCFLDTAQKEKLLTGESEYSCLLFLSIGADISFRLVYILQHPSGFLRKHGSNVSDYPLEFLESCFLFTVFSVQPKTTKGDFFHQYYSIRRPV